MMMKSILVGLVIMAVFQLVPSDRAHVARAQDEVTPAATIIEQFAADPEAPPPPDIAPTPDEVPSPAEQAAAELADQLPPATDGYADQVEQQAQVDEAVRTAGMEIVP